MFTTSTSHLLFATAVATAACGTGSAHAFNRALPFVDPVHERITSEALSDLTVSLSSGRTLKFDRLRIDFAVSANAGVDIDMFNIPYMHFDNESLVEGSGYLIRARAAIREFAKSGDYNWAIINLGTALHTVQDFYSHTTWIDRAGAAIPNFELGAQLILSATRTEKVCDRYTVLANPPLSSGYHAKAMFYSPTFEYWTNPWILTPGTGAQLWPENKCVHGSTNGDGLHKDHPLRLLHAEAYRAAVLSSRFYVLNIINDIRATAATPQDADEAICGLMTGKKCPVSDMLGSTLVFNRRWPTPSTPFPVWTPPTVSTVVAAGTGDRITWFAQGRVYAVVNPEAETISWTLPAASAYGGDASIFDGFVVEGFGSDIASVRLLSASGIGVSALTNTSRTVSISLVGNYPAGANFTIEVKLK